MSKTSLNINLLFIEILHKINVTFVIMLIFGEKKWHSSCDINYMKWYKYRLYIFCPHILNDVITLNVF